MLALVVTLCLNSDMTQCGDQVVAWLPYDNASRCVLDSRHRIAAWAQQNSEMSVAEVRCLPGRGGSPSVYRAAQRTVPASD